MEHEPSELLVQEIAVINIGVQDFGEALEEQSVQVVYVNWALPAGGNQEMIDLLDQLL